MLSTAPSVTPAEHLFLILDAVRRTIAATLASKQPRHWPAIRQAPLLLLLWSRLGRVAAAFARLAAQVAAGCVPPSRPARARPARARPARPRPAGARPAGARAAGPGRGTRWPRGRFWLIRLMQEVAVYGSQLQALLARPEMQALLEASPRAVRLLRPICRILLVPPTALPKPPAPPAAPMAGPENPRDPLDLLEPLDPPAGPGLSPGLAATAA